MVPAVERSAKKIYGSKSFKDILLGVDIAIDLFFKYDAYLLINRVHERSISNKLACYLQEKFKDWDVDTEYNRHGLDTKELPRECNQKNKRLVYPDIIVHKRGEKKGPDNNLLVIEIKPSPNLDFCDEAKLKGFTREYGDYHYFLGLFIGFNKDKDPFMQWFVNGTKSDIVKS